jgi:hypothetical protein
VLKAGFVANIRAEAAKEMGGALPWGADLQLDMWIFSIGGAAPDNDNVLKLVRDALEGVVYVNDRQVKRDRVIHHDLLVPVMLPGLPRRLAALATRGEPYIYVRLDTDVPWSVIS